MKHRYSFFSSKNSIISYQKLVLLLVLGIGMLSSQMQSAIAQSSSPSLRLKSSIEQYTSNTEQFKNDKSSFSDALFGNHYFLVVQFTTLPSYQERQNLKSKGIELIQYLPDLSYTAKINSTISNDKLEALISDFKIHAFVKLSVNQKTQTRLVQGDIPEWAISESNQVELNIIPFDTVNPMLTSMAMTNMGGKLIYESKVSGILTVSVPQTAIMQVANLPWVLWVESLPEPPKEENYYGKSAHRSAILNYGARNLDGSGVNLGIWDGGNVANHLDFSGRRTLVENTSDSDHGTHVAGTMAGAGLLNPRNTGMAPNAQIYSHNFNGDIATEMQNAITNFGIVITQNSYGGGPNCATGDPYGSNNRGQDLLVNNNPQLVHVFSSGNSQSSCVGGFGTTTGKAAKNTITVGALTNNDVITTFSSFGPLEDGRIKPEVSAFGNGVVSTLPSNGYGANSGTSMAAPGVSGTVAQLYQSYRQLNGNADPIASLMKAVLSNNADDLGNTGPDYKYGFGRINGLKAVKALEGNNYAINTVTTAGQNDVTIAVPAGTHELKVMLCWSDPAAAANANPALINNLDLEVLDPTTNTWLPWTLDGANPNNVAIRAVNNVDIIEQVTIPTPATGTYTLRVKGTAVPSGANQQYSLTWTVTEPYIEVTYPSAGMSLTPSATELIQWDMEGVSGTTSVEYSLDNGTTWTVINGAVAANTRRLSWTVPNAMTNEAKIRVSSTTPSLSGTSEAFSIIGVPTGITGQPCSGSAILQWNAVTDADEYIVYQLNTTTGVYTQIGTSATNTFTATGLSGQTWFSIRARNTTTGATSQRSVAFSITPAAGSGIDLELSAIVSPTQGCDLRTATEAITIRIKNLACSPIPSGTTIPVAYTVNGGTAVNENLVLASDLNGAASLDYTFTTTADMSAGGSYVLTSSVNLATDTNGANNAISNHTVQNNPPITVLPYTEDFENPSPAECWDIINDGAGVGTWQYGTNLGSSFFIIPDVPAGNQYAAANDDACPSPGCGAPYKSWLISPKFDFSSYSQIEMAFRAVFRTDRGEVRISTDRITWTTIHSMASISGVWQDITLDLDAYANEPQVWIAFYYDDLNTWGYGFAVDDVVVREKPIELVSFLPANNATNVDTNTSLALTFNRVPTIGTGSITLTGGATPIVIPVSATNTTITGNTATVTLPSALATSTTYSVDVPSSTFTANSLGFGGVLPANWQFTTITTSADADSRIVAPTTMPASASISSLATTSASAVEVFSFKVEDLATTDALPTDVTQIDVKQGAANTVTDWTTQLQGAELWSGGTQITATATITADRIRFIIPAGNASTASGTNTDYTVKVFLNTTGILDEGVLQFQIPSVAHGVQTSNSSSSFASTFPANVVSNTFTLDVVATRLGFSTVPTTATVSSNFAVSVQALDANGNIDRAARTITLLRDGGTGTGVLSATSGLGSRAMINGVFTWSDLQFDEIGEYSIRVNDDGSAFTDLSSLINVVAPTGGGGNTIPSVSAPTQFKAIAIDTSRIDLTWQAATNATGYKLYRLNRLVATLSASTLSYDDSLLNEDTFYGYRLEAFNSVSRKEVATNAVTYPKAPTLISKTDACAGGKGKIVVNSTHTTRSILWYESETATEPIQDDSYTFETQNLTAAKTYYVTANGIRYESQTRLAVTIDVKEIPVATILGDLVRSTCENTLTLEADTQNASSDLIYTWYSNGVAIQNSNAPTYQATRSGNYSLRITQNECVSMVSSTVQVKVGQVAPAQIEQGSQVLLCETGQLSALEVEGATYQWLFNDTEVGTSSSITVSNSGTYTLRVSKETCTQEAQINVEVISFPTDISITTDKEQFCTGEQGATISVSEVENAMYTLFRNGNRLRIGSENRNFTVNSSGEYHVEISLGTGCVFITDSVSIERIDVPTAHINLIEENIATITSTGTITEVEWNKDGEMLSVSSSLSLALNETGRYRAKVTYDTGCQAITSNSIFYRKPEPVTGVEDEEGNCCTVVYPNPTSSEVRLKLAANLKDAFTLTLTDGIGRTLITKSISKEESQQEIRLDLSKYASGMYFINVVTPSETLTFKIAKED
ncbi:S8 family serine peptidase [Bernardetia sp. Wsw4-3y2]|uniref:S8 family serine peptidase n=1 Tax=Bernardetia sp. Wsw4-3y2 TaxID=3127471 RepID=UPI0030D0FE50